MSISVYLAILVGAALFFVLGLLVGGTDGDVGHDGGGHHVGGHDSHHDGHMDDDGSALRNIFSVRSFLLFCIGFGASGALATAAGQSTILTLFLSSLFGIVTVTLGLMLIALLYRQEGNTLSSMLSLEGMSGKVINPIPLGGIGEVSVRDGTGSVRYVPARSEDGEAIGFDASIEVASVASGELVVRRIRSLPPVID